MIICPTRELCIQVQKVLDNLTRFFPWIISGLLVGGENIAHEKARIRKGLNVVIGTPGRINFHLKGTNNFQKLDN
jgi:ATP-dependent RNA helicase DDX31/DBP7